jgi:transposase
VKSNGGPEHTFYFHLKETEYRFNPHRGNLYAALLAVLKSRPI